MTRLLDAAELQHSAELVAREALALVARAETVREQLDRATANGEAPGVHIFTCKLAAIARQLTRAQAVLVHPEDERYHAAQAVMGYCDEADQRSPWEPAAPVLTIGVADPEAA